MLSRMRYVLMLGHILNAMMRTRKEPLY